MILADCGNTAVKLAQGASRERVLTEQVAAWLSTHPDEVLVLLAGAAANAAVVRQHWRSRLIEIGRDLALPDVGQYASMGIDRIVAGLAAGPGTIVIDAGTATTMTAWGADGRFAGGLILPGPHAMIAGLCQLAPALPAVEPGDRHAAAAQCDTRGAIAAGAGLGHAGMVAWCVSRLQAETGIMAVITTGAGAGGLPPLQADHRPWLVLEGMELLSAGR